jgi:hypothetical protein
MDINIQHMRACMLATGSPENTNWNVVWARLCDNPNHPQRLAIEAQFGKVFGNAGRKELQIQDVCAMTSMSPLPAKRQRQIDVVSTWKEFGLSVVSVNTAQEIMAMQPDFPDVEFIASSCQSTLFARPTQSIKKMVDIGRTVSRSVLLINSDIEIVGSSSVFQKCVAQKHSMVGIRHNYDDEIGTAICELWGIDVFLVPPHVEVPELGFVIGRPMWDYWMCWLLENSGPVEWIGTPLFFHKSHDLNWSTSEWTQGSEAFIEYYGVDIDWERWRRDRPFGVNHQRNLARVEPSSVTGIKSSASN